MNYNCEDCGFTTKKKANHQAHLKTKKHLNRIIKKAEKEKQKQSNWIFKKIANTLFPYIDTATYPAAFKRAQKKSFMDMRHMYLVPLNNYLDTTQIKMCDVIDFRWFLGVSGPWDLDNLIPLKISLHIHLFLSKTGRTALVNKLK